MYSKLQEVLSDAFEQAANGKGKDRHASRGEVFEAQVICEVGRRLGVGFNLGQAVKKVYESERLPWPRNKAELLGAINYLAAAVILLEEREAREEENG